MAFSYHPTPETLSVSVKLLRGNDFVCYATHRLTRRKGVQVQLRSCVIQVTDDAEASHMGPARSAKGADYDFWQQTAYLTTGSVFPSPITLRFDVLRAGPNAKNHLPLAPGFYLIPSGALVLQRGDVIARFEQAPVPLAEGVAELQELLKAAGGAGAAGGAARPLRAAS